ncbi:MAG TPA: hypothetical protein VIS71_09425, partial [Terrimicrobium sp.]
RLQWVTFIDPVSFTKFAEIVALTDGRGGGCANCLPLQALGTWASTTKSNVLPIRNSEISFGRNLFDSLNAEPPFFSIGVTGSDTSIPLPFCEALPCTSIRAIRSDLQKKSKNSSTRWKL